MLSILFEHYFLIGILIYLIFGIWMNLSPLYGFPKLTVNWTYLCSLLLVNSIVLLLVNYNEGTIFYNELFYKTQTEFLLNLFTLVMALFIVLGTSRYLELNKVNVFEYYIFFLLVVYSLLLIVGSTEFFSFYFALELLSMSLYLLAAYRKNYKISIESGIKYFLISSVSSILILFGFSFIYLYTGLTNFYDIYLFNLNTDLNSYMYLSFILMLSGFLIKLYSAPFHLWVADIYEGSYTSVVLIFACLPLLNVYYVLYKLYNLLYSQLDLYNLFAVLISLTLVVGTLGAFYQVKLKRLLAYSSIANIGYFLIYFLYPSSSMSYIVFAYMLFYCLSILSFLLVICNLYDVNKKKSIENWNELTGLYYSNKWLFVLLVLIIFSMGGLPPFPIFVAKWLLLSKLISLKAYSLVFFIILITFATFYYYIRMIKQMTYYTENVIILKPISYGSSFLIYFTFVLSVVIGFYFYFSYSDLSLTLGYDFSSLISKNYIAHITSFDALDIRRFNDFDVYEFDRVIEKHIDLSMLRSFDENDPYNLDRLVEHCVACAVRERPIDISMLRSFDENDPYNLDRLVEHCVACKLREQPIDVSMLRSFDENDPYNLDRLVEHCVACKIKERQVLDEFSRLAEECTTCKIKLKK